MINVVCAVISDDRGRVLVCQRSETQSHPGKWEFPGGKVETDENRCEALIREIHEELGCDVTVGDQLPVVEHHYPLCSIRLMPYRCQLCGAKGPEALEHAQFQWIKLSECAAMDWAEADIPIWQQMIVE